MSFWAALLPLGVFLTRGEIAYILGHWAPNGHQKRKSTPVLKASLNKRDGSGWRTLPFSDVRVPANWKTWQHFLFVLPVFKSRSGSQRLFRYLITPLYTSQGWRVLGERWCYQSLTDGDQEARLRHQVAIVLVKCLTGYEMRRM